MDLGGFHDSRDTKFENLWRRSPSPPNKKSPGPGSLDPEVLEAWRLGGLEAHLLAGF